MKWEYKTRLVNTTGWLGGKLDDAKMTARLNGLGAGGWELVTGFDTNLGHGMTRHVVLVLKRPKSTPTR